jgi:hypothetical protein
MLPLHRDRPHPGRPEASRPHCSSRAGRKINQTSLPAVVPTLHWVAGCWAREPSAPAYPALPVPGLLNTPDHSSLAKSLVRGGGSSFGSGMS